MSGPGALTLAAVGVLAVVLWRLRRRASASATELTAAVLRLADGDFSARARLEPDDELEPAAYGLNRLAETVASRIESLSRDRAQLSTILAHIVEAVVAVDADGRVLAWNPALRAVFETVDAPAVGRPFVETLRHPKLQDLLTGVLKEGRPRVEEVSVFAPREAHFEAHAVPILEEGRQTGALLVLHDITRMRRLENLRREFVANVSHELRTPLASIQGFAETLRDGALEDPKHRLEFVEAIEQDAARLSALVEDLLDLSAIESGHRPLNRQPVDVLALTREAAAALKPLADRRGVSVSVEAGAAEVSADRGQLKQVLSNLLDNAVKFNREGGKVFVSAVISAKAVEITVRDSGLGIPTEDLPRVFERFYRVDKARGRDVGGTGLGLSIVKHIVEAHGGTVSVSSVPGEGSTFLVSLPR